jgi:hypothetical protein
LQGRTLFYVYTRIDWTIGKSCGLVFQMTHFYFMKRLGYSGTRTNCMLPAEDAI